MRRIILREIVLGLWKVHILHHAAEGRVVGNHLLHELREHGYDASPGTLYPLLHRMESHGWLQSDPDESAALHAQRAYEITPEGLAVLELCAGHVSELNEELEQGSWAKSQKDRRAKRGRRRSE
jgi:PadR family transcriptional regulator, regulatory protein PadR